MAHRRFSLTATVSIAIMLCIGGWSQTVITVDGLVSDHGAAVAQQFLQSGFHPNGTTNALYYVGDAEVSATPGFALAVAGSLGDTNDFVIALNTGSASATTAPDVAALTNGLDTDTSNDNYSDGTAGVTVFDFPVDTLIICHETSAGGFAFDVSVYTLEAGAASQAELVADELDDIGTAVTSANGIIAAFVNNDGEGDSSIGVEGFTGTPVAATQDPLSDPDGFEIFIPSSFGLGTPTQGFAYLVSGTGYLSNQALPPYTDGADGDKLPHNPGSSTSDETQDGNGGGFTARGAGFPDHDFAADIAGDQSVTLAVPPITTGYLFYAGGAVPTSGDAIEGQDFDSGSAVTTDNAVFSVLVADVDIAAGTVTNWRRATTPGNLLPEANGATGATAYSWMYLENAVNVHNERLYVGPADWNGDTSRDTADVVAWADIDQFGNLGPWTLSDPILNDSTDQAICPGRIIEVGGNAYYHVLGGTVGQIATVAVAPISAVDGSLGAWTQTTDMPVGSWFNGATAVGDTLITATGHNTADRHIYYASPSSVDGSISSWSDGGLFDPGAGARWAYGMCTANVGTSEFAIILGGTGPTPNPAVNVSPVTGGVPGAWTATNDLPVAKRQITAAGMDDLIAALGGADDNVGGGTTDAVQIGRIDGAGAITWGTAGDALLQARAFGGAAFHRTAFPTTTGVTNYELYR